MHKGYKVTKNILIVVQRYSLESTFFVQIVRHDRTLEQIVFPIPEICEYLTSDTKTKILNTAERDDQGSKVSDFFERTEDMFSEMKWQKKLRGRTMYLPYSPEKRYTRKSDYVSINLLK